MQSAARIYDHDDICIKAETAALPTRSTEELLELKIRSDEKMALVKTQIEAARAEASVSGTYADNDWWIRANGLCRMLASLSQRIQLELRKRKQLRSAAQKQADDTEFLAALKQAMRQHLADEKYRQIIEAATEIQAAIKDAIE